VAVAEYQNASSSGDHGNVRRATELAERHRPDLDRDAVGELERILRAVQDQLSASQMRSVNGPRNLPSFGRAKFPILAGLLISR
jgi:hypothetical protein